MNIINIFSILFLLLKVTLLNAFASWQIGFGFENMMEEIMMRAGGPNYMHVREKWIQQWVDHSVNDPRRWNMRYFEYLDNFQPNGPIYLYIGGEAAINISNPQGVTSLDKLSRETGGAVFMSEHRYYGESMPSNDLKYLSSTQALADLANLIIFIKSQPGFQHSKVVAVGGSYAGNLAAWMRARYPNLVDCAWASSAPVLAKKDFYEYYEQVGEDYMTYGGMQCYQNIMHLFGLYEKWFQTSQGIQPFNKAFLTEYIHTQIWPFANQSQYGDPLTIQQLCDNVTDIINNYDLNYYQSLYNDYYYDNTVNRNQYYEYDALRARCYNLKGNDRSWYYQKCTEFGYFKTTKSNNQPFPKDINLNYFIPLCSCFGYFDEATIDTAVANTNLKYGGLRPKVTRVIFLHGSLDPWHRLGITEDLSEDVPAILIEGTSHCSDLFPYEVSEPAALIVARDYAERMIKYWLGLGARPYRYEHN